MSFWFYHGDCVEVMRNWVEASFDALVSDPPYGLAFMGKQWDRLGDTGAQIDWHQRWGEQAFRLLKPGAHLLAFSGARTYHYLALGLELAGFELRDSMHWFYGTGFPKSLNVGGGCGTALKPGHEPITLARKPLVGTVAENIAAFGTGALNIDACRLGRDDVGPSREGEQPRTNGVASFRPAAGPRGGSPAGRWPSNVLLDEASAAELDAQKGCLKSGGSIGAHTAAAAAARQQNVAYSSHTSPRGEWVPYGDEGGASRFFYVAKPSRTEREMGCEALPLKSAGDVTDREDGSAGLKSPRAGAGRMGGAKNYHPTVKPVELMRYLCRLVTPANGIVLDPFMGSGTTGVAALHEGLRFVGIEREFEYLPIAVSRLSHAGAQS